MAYRLRNRYRQRNIGLKSCGKHPTAPGEWWHAETIDVNCMRCIRWPKRKSDAQYVQELRKLAGVDPIVRHVTVGEQLVLVDA